MAPRLILASASPARLRLLRAAGLNPEVVVSGFDEDSLIEDDPARLVAKLAEAKATTVASSLGGAAIILGCDSMLVLGRETSHQRVLGKPGSPDEAVARWKEMRGTTGHLLTGHCLIDTTADVPVVEVGDTAVAFASVTDAEIEAYVATGEPVHVAGAFTIDGHAAPFIDHIVGDHGNVIGVSLPLLRLMLQRLGLAITDFWSH